MLAQYNPAIGSTAAQAASDVNAAANAAGTNLTNVAGNAAQNIAGAAGNANAYLNPFATMGTGAATTLADLMSPGGALMKNFTLDDMKTLDPGYQFRIDMANKMAAQSAAARGGALGGGALQGLSQLNQNLASSEMQNAFNRFQTQQQNRFSNLYNMAGMGMNAGNLMGQNLMGAAQIGGNWLNNAAQTAGGWGLQGSEFGGNLQAQAAQAMANNAIGTQRSIADLMTGGANAQAAGTMGAANAWGGMLGGLANTAGQVGNYYQQKNLLSQLPFFGGYGGYGYGGGYGNPNAPFAGYPTGGQAPQFDYSREAKR